MYARAVQAGILYPAICACGAGSGGGLGGRVGRLGCNAWRVRAGRRHIRKPGEEKDHREEAKERIRKEAAARLGTFQVARSRPSCAFRVSSQRHGAGSDTQDRGRACVLRKGGTGVPVLTVCLACSVARACGGDRTGGNGGGHCLWTPPRPDWQNILLVRARNYGHAHSQRRRGLFAPSPFPCPSCSSPTGLFCVCPGGALGDAPSTSVLGILQRVRSVERGACGVCVMQR